MVENTARPPWTQEARTDSGELGLEESDAPSINQSIKDPHRAMHGISAGLVASEGGACPHKGYNPSVVSSSCHTYIPIYQATDSSTTHHS